ncbi:MAG: NifB/NifX family molybdenum-iron cluster-binding protein [Proteobacteria bacterium]|nr:NifB/NifX family molybdenum-iron cluster-binding protein [Pseudomonadota bacterium]
MKIAIPTKTDDTGVHVVDSHFGHCEFFTVLTLDDETKEVTVEEHVAAPSGCGCKSNIAATMAAEGVTILLAGNMGQGAVDKLAESGIQTVRGLGGPVRDGLQAWLDGKVQDQPEICDHDHGDDGHGCHHHEIPTLKPLN